MTRWAIALSFLSFSSMAACGGECTEGSTTLNLKLRTGEFGVAGDVLRFSVASSLGVLASDCALVVSGEATCSNKDLSVKIVESPDRKIRGLTLSLNGLPRSVQVTISRTDDGTVVAGPAEIAFPNSSGGPCPRTQMGGAAL